MGNETGENIGKGIYFPHVFYLSLEKTTCFLKITKYGFKLANLWGQGKLTLTHPTLGMYGDNRSYHT